MAKWRNGRRACLKSKYPKGCVGSNPSLATMWYDFFKLFKGCTGFSDPFTQRKGYIEGDFLADAGPDIIAEPEEDKSLKQLNEKIKDCLKEMERNKKENEGKDPMGGDVVILS
jgi:hypothetical protein